MNEMSLGVINLKTGCFTKTWVSVVLSTLVSAFLSLYFLRANLTFLLRSLNFRSPGNQPWKMSTLSEASGAMQSVEDAAGKAEIQSSLNFRSGFCPPYTGCALSINLPPRSAILLFSQFHAFPHTAVVAK